MNKSDFFETFKRLQEFGLEFVDAYGMCGSFERIELNDEGDHICVVTEDYWCGSTDFYYENVPWDIIELYLSGDESWVGRVDELKRKRNAEAAERARLTKEAKYELLKKQLGID